jgi:hypothetical protein
MLPIERFQNIVRLCDLDKSLRLSDLENVYSKSVWWDE